MVAPFQPELFGDFLLIQRLARRSMAEALLAVRLGDRSGRAMVVKRPVLGERASGRAARAIAREGQILATVRARQLPILEACGELAGLPYVAIEHVRGASLDTLLTPAAPLPPGAVRAVALDLARALAALHAAGFVHSDVTPSNVIIDDAGEARLVDLGLARRVGEARTEEIAGTPGYIAPEAALPGDVQPAEDVYGWGVVVAECALGRPLYTEHDLVEAAARAGPPREIVAWEEHVPSLSAALSRVPAARPSLAAVIHTLEALPCDRASLAERVESLASLARTEIDGMALTPTAPMSLLAAEAPPPRLPAPPPRLPGDSHRSIPTVVAPTAVSTAPTSVPAPTPAPLPRRLLRSLALTLIGLALFGAGNLVARVQLRDRPASLSFNGALPRRAQLELDGKRIALPSDGRLVLSSGDHFLVIVLPRGARREYTFHVRPNEHIIVVPPTRAQSGPADADPEERGP